MALGTAERTAFAHHLRTGRRGSRLPGAIEVKFNPNHEPANGQFTSGGREAGERGHGAGASSPGSVVASRPARDAGDALRRAAEYAMRAAAGKRSEGKCYVYVKRALKEAGAVADYIPGVPAKDAGPALSKRGFVNLLASVGAGIHSPYDAPEGAVLVYSPTADARDQRYGHIELRTKHGFASDYISARARTGPSSNGLKGLGRVLTGVWVKP